MKTMFKDKLLVLLSALVILLCGAFGVRMLMPQDEAKADVTGTPTLTIESNNVSYAESIYILYAVSNSGFDRNVYEIKMLFWEEIPEDYVVGTESYSVIGKSAATVKDKDCLIYYTDGFAAKEMTDEVYARACVEIDSVTYYSDVSKFSVLEYVYTQRAAENLTSAQTELYDAMLEYGAAAQTLFDYKTDRLANATYYGVSVENGTLADGFRFGRFVYGETVQITADFASEGQRFSHWVDELGNTVSTENSFSITVTEEKTYTAVYNKKGLVYEISENGMYATVTSYDDTATQVRIADRYEGVPVTEIGSEAFMDRSNLTDVNIPDSVTRIGDYAFGNCSALTEIVIPDGVTSIGKGAFAACDSLTVYCEAEIQPSGWAADWNPSNRPVFWYSENEPALNSGGTAYDGNFWKYDENGGIVVWTYTFEEEIPDESEENASEAESSSEDVSKPEESEPEEPFRPVFPENAVVITDDIWREDKYALSAETTENVPEGFSNVTEFDWKNNSKGWGKKWTDFSSYTLDAETDLSNYSDIYFAIKVVNGAVYVKGLEETEWYNGGDWLYVHYQQAEDGTWSLVSLHSLDGSYAKTDVQTGIDNVIASTDADTGETIVDVAFPTLRGLMQDSANGGLYAKRDSIEDETVVYMTDVLGVVKGNASEG